MSSGRPRDASGSTSFRLLKAYPPTTLKAADTLSEDGISARVIDLYSLQPVDTETLQKAARDFDAAASRDDKVVMRLERALTRDAGLPGRPHPDR